MFKYIRHTLIQADLLVKEFFIFAHRLLHPWAEWADLGCPARRNVTYPSSSAWTQIIYVNFTSVRARTVENLMPRIYKDIQGTDLLLPGPWLSPHLILLLCTSCNSVLCQAKVVHYERSGQCSKATQLRQQTLQDFCFGSPLRARLSNSAIIVCQIYNWFGWKKDGKEKITKQLNFLISVSYTC